MKQYIKPQTVIVSVNIEQHLLEASTLEMNVHTEETHSAEESFGRRGGDYWDDDE